MSEKELLSTIVCNQDAPLKTAASCIEASNGEICLVVDDQNRLVGTVTDGDIRRALLAGVNVDSPTKHLMQKKPKFCLVGCGEAEIRKVMLDNDIHQVPIVDRSHKLINVIFDRDINKTSHFSRENEVVIIAGGLGTRLRPMTNTIPKPMIEVAGKPIIHIILENFKKQGFGKCTICINYLGSIIKDYFGNGDSVGMDIRYVEERKKLGTAGALSLLPEIPKSPFIVMNGDILTRTNFGKIIDFHEETYSDATMAVNEYTMNVPYGVVNTKEHEIISVEEKPNYKFFVNAGIYALSPETLKYIPKDQYFDMPNLFSLLRDNSKATSAFPIHEYWVDVGQPADLDRARQEAQAKMDLK